MGDRGRHRAHQPKLGRNRCCALIRQFPFRILGFHSDNGSEFINRIVARLLNKLLIEQTKSRPRHSNDNGLAETNNGAVIRKHLGYGYIFDEKGRRRCFYRRYQTTLETLLALPNPAQYLRPGLTPAVLQRIAETRSDTEAAQRMQQAKRQLFAPLRSAVGGPWK
jgi:transposase InsO family protein